MRFSTLLIVLSLLFATESVADLVECDGVWTNEPCEGQALSVIDEEPGRELTPEERRKKDIDYLLRNLSSTRYRAEREIGVPINTAVARSACEAENATVDLCRETVAKRVAEIERMLMSHLQAQEKREEERPPRALRERESTQINIVTPDRGFVVGPPCCGTTCAGSVRCRRGSRPTGVAVSGRAARVGAGVSVNGSQMRSSSGRLGSGVDRVRMRNSPSVSAIYKSNAARLQGE